MHFRSPGFDLNDLVTAIEANVTANMWAHTRSDTGVRELTLTPLDGAGTSLVHSTGLVSKWKGTQALADTLPQVAPIIKLTTTTRGRSARGRIFLPWPQETACNSSVLDATIRTAMQTAWSAFNVAMATAGNEIVIASYLHATKAIVVEAFVEQLLGTQRRRQPRPT